MSRNCSTPSDRRARPRTFRADGARSRLRRRSESSWRSAKKDDREHSEWWQRRDDEPRSMTCAGAVVEDGTVLADEAPAVRPDVEREEERAEGRASKDAVRLD